MNWTLFLTILQSVGQSVLYLIPATRPIASLILHAMEVAMSLPTATGPERKTLALAIIADGIESMNIAAGHVVLDVATTMAAASNGIELAYAIAKLIHDAHQAA